MQPADRRVDVIATALEESARLLVLQLIDRTELNLTALDALQRLDTGGPARLTALASAVGVTQPAMTQLVQRFERQGIVTRSVDRSDGRASLITITEAGRTLLEQRREKVRVRLCEMLDTLGADELDTLELTAKVSLPLIKALNASTTAPTTRQEIA